VENLSSQQKDLDFASPFYFNGGASSLFFETVVKPRTRTTQHRVSRKGGTPGTGRRSLGRRYRRQLRVNELRAFGSGPSAPQVAVPPSTFCSDAWIDAVFFPAVGHQLHQADCAPGGFGVAISSIRRDDALDERRRDLVFLCRGMNIA
jgi:hypothetical protein